MAFGQCCAQTDKDLFILAVSFDSFIHFILLSFFYPIHHPEEDDHDLRGGLDGNDALLFKVDVTFFFICATMLDDLMEAAVEACEIILDHARARERKEGALGKWR